jgi:serine/threonine-protein kinase
MGTVYVAEQLGLKRKVALKVLDPALFGAPENVQRFHAEAETAAKLSHPHTVTLYDFGQTDTGLLFIAMELIQGKSLRAELTSGGALPAERTLDIGEQIASSIADAHEHGIVHRDIKPDNVMLSERAGRKDFVRVLDFGIAKLRDQKAGGISSFPAVTRQGDILGTPLYMSPEQIQGERVDGRTDVYALGVMLYEMVSARLPFDANTVVALLSMHIHAKPIPLTDRRPDLVIPHGVVSLINRCLAKSRDARPATMEAVRSEMLALKDALSRASGPTHAPSGPPYPGQSGPLYPGTPPSGPVYPPPSGPIYVAPPATGPTFVPPGPTYSPPPGSGPVYQPPPGNAPVHAPLQGSAPVYPAPASPPPVASAPPPSSPAIAGPAATHPIRPDASSSRTSSKAALWIILGVLLLGGGGAGIYFLTRSHDSAGPKPPPQGDDTSTHDKTPPSDGWRVHNSKFPFYLDVPNGFTFTEQTAEVAGGYGEVNGQHSAISALALQLPREADDQQLAQFAEQIPQGTGGTLVEKRTRTVAGGERVSVIYDMPVQSLRAEVVLFPHGNLIVALVFATPAFAFDASSTYRDYFFQRLGFD